MIFQHWRLLSEKNALIKSLWVVIGLMILVNILLFIGWQSAPNRLRIYVAPTQIANGAIVKAGDVPSDLVYAFAFEIFTAINTWSFDGIKDYKTAIQGFRYYLTVPFYQMLEGDYQTRLNHGSLSRLRAMTGVSGMAYQDADVVAKGRGVWDVTLHVKVQEHVNETPVKDVLIDYHLRIVQVNLPTELNPWGLAIDGFSSSPTRVKTIL